MIDEQAEKKFIPYVIRDKELIKTMINEVNEAFRNGTMKEIYTSGTVHVRPPQSQLEQ